MEGSYFLRSCASSLWPVRLHRNRRHDPCWGSTQIPTLDPIHRGFRVAIYRIRCLEIWRSWNGCAQVRSWTWIKPQTELNFPTRSLRPLIISLAPGQARTLSRLKIMREELSNELAASINEFGPKMYEDFDQVSFLGGAPCSFRFD